MVLGWCYLPKAWTGKWKELFLKGKINNVEVLTLYTVSLTILYTYLIYYILYILLKGGFFLPLLLVLGRFLGFFARQSWSNWSKTTCKLSIESLSSPLCPRTFTFLQQKDDLNSGLKQMENWSASPTWAAVQTECFGLRASHELCLRQFFYLLHCWLF